VVQGNIHVSRADGVFDTDFVLRPLGNEGLSEHDNTGFGSVVAEPLLKPIDDLSKMNRFPPTPVPPAPMAGTLTLSRPSVGVYWEIPAEVTRPSILPNCWIVASTAS
jgi:hypothetical protein